MCAYVCLHVGVVPPQSVSGGFVQAQQQTTHSEN